MDLLRFGAESLRRLVVAEEVGVFDLELLEAEDLDLTDAFAGQVEDFSDLFERDAASVSDIERTGLFHLPRLKVGEVELDGSRLGIHIEIEVKLAGDPRTGAWAVCALASMGRSHMARGRDDLIGLRDLILGEAARVEGLRPTETLSALALCDP
jgi:hypothetical protein